MSVDTLTPTEANALKWVQFAERMDRLNGRYEDGEIDAYEAWDATQYNYRLMGGLK